MHLLYRNEGTSAANQHSTFSPEGRLFQVEYSLEAIKLGSTAIGVRIYAPCKLAIVCIDHF